MSNKLYELYLEHPVITTDSRNCPADSIFFALQGTTFNGNLFAAKALESGCVAVVVDDASVVPKNDQRYFLVDNVLETLQELASYHRQQFKAPVIQITGTNGKTTTKELTAAVLSQKYNVLYTQGNLNNHIGVPLTLLRLRLNEHNIAIVETGSNNPGEIAFLANIVNPDYGLITNVGCAHLKGFGSLEGVKKEKGALYDFLIKKNGCIFADENNSHLMSMLKERNVDLNSEKYLLYTHKNCTPFMANSIQGSVVSCNPFLEVEWTENKSETYHITTQLVGAYNLDNILSAICIGRYFNVAIKDINQALTDYKPGLGRSEIRNIGSNVLIVDAYNANPTSMNAAIENFKQITHKNKIAILGDMYELGDESATAHQQILQLLFSFHLQQIWLVGAEFKKAVQCIAPNKNNIFCFPSIEDVKEHLSNNHPEDSCILIKGSNSTKLYQLPELFK